MSRSPEEIKRENLSNEVKKITDKILWRSDYSRIARSISISEISWCLNRALLTRAHGIKFESSFKMIRGSIIHKWLELGKNSRIEYQEFKMATPFVGDFLIVGTLDAMYNIDEKLYIVDYKTGKQSMPAVQSKYKLQLAGYLFLFYNHEKKTNKHIDDLGKVEGAFNEYIDPDNFESLCVYFDKDDLEKEFKTLLDRAMQLYLAIIDYPKYENLEEIIQIYDQVEKFECINCPVKKYCKTTPHKEVI